ncbi:Actin/actin-like protein [Cryphonectria parasitica EP155]|uniref:Actin/actin-like protein n=1 Tax=Cryphonectria parasitica (strain ATCC 38755 / EP155) TaxID=660469 RepID=A0A9P4XVC4_CRYP1|nr:Actin/actin-like protein [Cryphonectria parasitica EP155]KAF3761596.1 Actin/actin-like protein [Cryphonectria parasitica EP155]
MAPRRSKPVPPPRPSRTLVLDNGAHTIKAGFVTDDTVDEPRVIPNCIARDRARKTYVASGLDKCKDFGEISFRRPVEKGYIVNWEAQKEIWDHEFFAKDAPQACDPADSRLVLTEQPNALPALQANCDQIVFEEFGFASYYRGIAPTFNAYEDIQTTFRTPGHDTSSAQLPVELMLLIDSGYSFTTITPIFQGRPLQSAIRRLEVGGKLLTNYLTRLLSLRHYDMRNDTYIVNEIKEKTCYVSLDFKGDLDKTWKGTRGERREPYLTGAGIAKDYVLPDFHARSSGIVRDFDATSTAKQRKLAAAASNEDILTLRNERFAIPEILFNPTDIGMPTPGLADLVYQVLQALPVGLWPGLLANILVVGGNTQFDGFIQRLQREIVARVPDECTVRVARPANSICATWRGAANFARHEHVERLAVTKQEYEENGAAWVAKKFAAGLGPD